MRKIREYISVEETFQYENEEERLKHEDIMFIRGYAAKQFLPHTQNNLQVDYRKTECRYVD